MISSTSLGYKVFPSLSLCCFSLSLLKHFSTIIKMPINKQWEERKRNRPTKKKKNKKTTKVAKRKDKKVLHCMSVKYIFECILSCHEIFPYDGKFSSYFSPSSHKNVKHLEKRRFLLHFINIWLTCLGYFPEKTMLSRVRFEEGSKNYLTVCCTVIFTLHYFFQ
jgi:hypothetical protein